MAPPTFRSGPHRTPGVVGSAGRYPTVTAPAPALRIAGGVVLPVGPLRVYSCGITPYDVTHVGHASTFVWADLVASLAGLVGSEALLCRNVTDIDDVLMTAAREGGKPFDALALNQEFLFDRDMRALAVDEPSYVPHARAYVGAVQRLAAALLVTGAAYERAGHVYFRGAHVAERAGLDREAALRASREFGDQGDAPHREDELDVAVWRPSGETDPAWPSPWGWGRPGWHAECAAMAAAVLGTSVDVLVGGSDLAFPHHAYQAAMVEAATGVRPFAQAVLHVGEVRLDGAKMAKSARNLVLVGELLERHPGAVVRLALLNRPHDEPWDCTEAVFTDAAEVLERLHRAAAVADGMDGRERVLERLCHELDVPGALEVALTEGGEAARFLIDVLKLTRRD